MPTNGWESLFGMAKPMTGAGQGMSGGDFPYANSLYLGMAAAPSVGQGLAGFGSLMDSASLYGFNARTATSLAGQQAQEIRIGGARRSGATAAAYGASGVQVGSGTPLEVLHDQAIATAQQALFAKYQGKVAAWEANYKKTNAQVGAFSSLAGGLLGGFGSSVNAAYGAGIFPTVGNRYDFAQPSGGAFYGTGGGEGLL